MASIFLLFSGAFAQDAPPGPSDSPAAASIEALDAENGSQGAAFSTALSAFEGMSLVEGSPEGWAKYARSGDTLSFGAARLSSNSYSFYADQLGRVALEAGGVDCERLLSELQSRYGAGVRQNEALEETWWVGQKVDLQFSNADQRCVAVFESKDVLELSTAGHS
jgi:hypothetical protein